MVGVEPTLQRNTILSRARLPIPPHRHKSGRRDSNPRPQPWQGCILPLNYFRMTNTISYTIINGAGEGTRTPTPKAPDPKSGASANSATPASFKHLIQIRWWRGTDSNRRTLRERIYSPPRLATSLPLQKMFKKIEFIKTHKLNV